MSNILRIFDIERFAVHDGSGIRTVVFMQGCPLRCPWCANPESWQIAKQLMFIKENCRLCMRCVACCPEKALRLEENEIRVDRNLCVGCGSCVQTCAQNAFRFVGQERSVDQILATVLRDKPYYDNSKGGITISGGEPFVQFEGFWELLQKSKAAGLNVAVETTGQVQPEHFKQAEPLIDLFLFDMKHSNHQTLRDTTRGDLRIIRENLSWLAKRALQKVILRIPVIPGFNDSSDVVGVIFEDAARLGVNTVHLLPYHSLGKSKFEQLGIPYTLHSEMAMMGSEQLADFSIIGEKMGIDVKIGG